MSLLAASRAGVLPTPPCTDVTPFGAESPASCVVPKGPSPAHRGCRLLTITISSTARSPAAAPRAIAWMTGRWLTDRSPSGRWVSFPPCVSENLRVGRAHVYRPKWVPGRLLHPQDKGNNPTAVATVCSSHACSVTPSRQGGNAFRFLSGRPGQGVRFPNVPSAFPGVPHAWRGHGPERGPWGRHHP